MLTSNNPGGSSEKELVDNPIDFEEQRAINEDVYAWIYVPNTNVDYAVVQHPTDDYYYLNHDINGNVSVAGIPYTQLGNSKDFSDPVTVIYGHNVVNGKMFSTLHYFEDTDFFNENEFFYIYTPGHILTYQIISAYMFDDRHIVNSYDFTKPEVRTAYFQTVANPNSLLQNIRQGIELTADSKIVQLSTCMSEASLQNQRYLVSGVLVNDQATR